MNSANLTNQERQFTKISVDSFIDDLIREVESLEEQNDILQNEIDELKEKIQELENK